VPHLVRLLKGALAALFAVVPLAAIGGGKTHMWTGLKSSDWSEAQNWDDGEAPSDGDIVYLLGGSKNPHVEKAAGLALAELHMETDSLSGMGIMAAGVFIWARGTIAMDITVGSAGVITGDVTLTQSQSGLPTTFVNGGYVVMVPGVTLSLDFGTHIQNLGLWSAQLGTRDSVIKSNNCCAKQALFENKGTLTTGGSPRLVISNMGYHGSRKSILSGAVTLDYGLHVLEPDSVVDGSGTVVTLTGNGHLTASGTITLTGGPTLVQSGAFLDGVNDAPLTLEGKGGDATYRWLGGTITASPTFGAHTALEIDSAQPKLLGDGVREHGHLNVTTAVTHKGTGVVGLYTGSQIVNGGSWTVPSSQSPVFKGNACCADAAAFRNVGKLLLGPGATLTVANAMFDNRATGVVSGGALRLMNGPHQFRPNATVTGAATSVQVFDRGSLTGDGVANFKDGAALMLGGNAAIDGTMDIEGKRKFVWSGGHLAGTLDLGTGIATEITDVAADQTHERSVAAATPKTAVKLIIEGGATQDSKTPIAIGPGAEITNRIGSHWIIRDGGLSGTVCCASPAIVSNLGTIEVDAAGRQVKLAQLEFRNRGMLKVGAGTLLMSGVAPTQYAGTTELAGTISSKDFRLAGGTLTGTGTIEGNLSNDAGMVAPGSDIGTLTVSGVFRQGASGSTIFDLTSGTSDLLQVGTASLGGTVNLHQAQSAPLSRVSRTLVAAGKVTAPFAAMTGLATLGSPFKLTSDATSIRLEPAGP
jgi:hypothetical protein